MNKFLRFLFLTAFFAVAATVSAAVDNLYITGGFTSPSWSASDAIAMTKASDGSFSYDVPAEGGSCKISTVKGSWDEFNAGAKTYESKPEIGGVAVALKSSDANIDVPASKSGVTIKIDADFTSIQFLGEASTDIPDIYLAGSINNWSFLDEYKFAYEETNASGEYVYKLDIATLSGTFKIANSTWTINLGGANITANDEYTLYQGGNDCSVSGEFSDVTLSVFYDSKGGNARLVVAAQSAPDNSTPVDLYLRGDINNWDTSNQLTFVETNSSSENVYKISLDELSGNFKIADASWSEQYNFGGEEYLSVTDEVVGGGLALVAAANSQNIGLPDGASIKNAVLTLYVKTDRTAWLDINGTYDASVSAIEIDANSKIEYFNLHGIKIKTDNLAPGLYIRRQGSTVTKVICK